MAEIAELMLSAARAVGVSDKPDGWHSALTGIGEAAYDKRVSHQHASQLLSYQTISRLWETDDITAKAIEAPGAECFREGYDITIPDEGKYKDLKKDVEAELLRLGVDTAIEKALQYQRAFGGAAILIGTNDGRDGGDLIDELEPAKVKSVDYLNVLEPVEITPYSFYNDPFSPKYGQPEYFLLENTRMRGAPAPVPGAKATAPVLGQRFIHESRLIIFQGIQTSNFYPSTNRPVSEYWGASILPRFYEILRDHGVAFAGAGLLATDVSQPVIAIEGLREMVAKNQNRLRERMQALALGRSVARTIIIDADKEKFERQTTQLGGIPELLDRLSQRLAAAVGIPLSILIGYSQATLGAPDSGELTQWYNLCRGIQRRKLTPILRQVIDLIMRTLRQRKIPPYEIAWAELEHQTVQQAAESRLTQSRTDANDVKSGMVYPDELRQSRFRGKYSYSTQINESKKAPGFMAPLPAGVLPGTIPAAGVITAAEAGVPGAAPAAHPGANAHAVSTYTRKNPKQPLGGKAPPLPSPKADALDALAQAGELMRTFADLPIVIENPKGSTRSWTDRDGNSGSTKMRYDYGFIDGTCATDGDAVDVYLGPNENAQWVYVIHQMNKSSDFTTFDEDKVMLGFDSANHARDAYLGQYDDERFFGGMSQMTMDDFKRQLATAAAGRITHRVDELDESAILEQLERIESRDGKWNVLSQDHSQVLMKFDAEQEAIAHLARLEFYKSQRSAFAATR